MTDIDLFTTLFNAIPSNSNFPPYDIIRIDDNNFRIDLAAAGYNEQDFEILYSGNTIKVSALGAKKDSGNEYLHHGIARRSFTRSFTVANHVKVKEATYVNGILSISLHREIPKELQPQKIKISTI